MKRIGGDLIDLSMEILRNIKNIKVVLRNMKGVFYFSNILK